MQPDLMRKRLLRSTNVLFLRSVPFMGLVAYAHANARALSANLDCFANLPYKLRGSIGGLTDCNAARDVDPTDAISRCFGYCIAVLEDDGILSQ